VLVVALILILVPLSGSDFEFVLTDSLGSTSVLETGVDGGSIIDDREQGAF